MTGIILNCNNFLILYAAKDSGGGMIYTVQYGCETFKTRCIRQALHEFDCQVRHYLTCEGMLDE